MCRIRRQSRLLAIPQLLLIAAFPACDTAPPTGSPPTSQPAKEATMSAKMTLKSAAFGPNETIPRPYTGDGENKSPPLSWSGAPAETKQLALIVDDPDAPTPTPWVHWVLYAIPPDTTSLPEGIAPSLRVSQPPALMQGKNSFGKVGYGGPAPPRGHGRHRYFFKLYALNAPLSVEPGLFKEALLKAMSGHVLAEGELIGTYER
jgi:Raf kinase inhibitor-like YbhB/YbcL family protein